VASPDPLLSPCFLTWPRISRKSYYRGAPSVIADSMEHMRKHGRTLRCLLPDKQQRFYQVGADRCARPILPAGLRPPHGVRHSHAPVNQRPRIGRQEARQLLAKGDWDVRLRGCRWRDQGLAFQKKGSSEKFPRPAELLRPGFCFLWLKALAKTEDPHGNAYL